MDNSNKASSPTFVEKIIAIVGLLAIIELLLFAGKIFGSISPREYGLFAVALPVIIVIGILPLLCKCQAPIDKRVEKRYRITHGLNAERFPYLSIRGMLRNAIPAWLLSILLVALIVWRLEVDSVFFRKILCAVFFGMISVIWFLVGVALCRMRTIITFRQDRFCILRTRGLGDCVEKDFAYDAWRELRPSQSQESDVSVLTLIGFEGDFELLKCRVSKSQADEICAYVNEQISTHQANHESLAISSSEGQFRAKLLEKGARNT